MKCTVADYIIKYIDSQYIKIDDNEYKFVEGVFTIFGHGNVLGIGQSLEFCEHSLNVIQGKNEQGMALAAMGFSKERNRTAIYAVTTSIGPGCTNLVTAAACATVNRIPMLLLPGDSFESGQPDPVLQQVENNNSSHITATDTLKPVSKYYDRVSHPEQIHSILERAFATLTDPEETGAVTIALPQDIQSEIIEYDPESIKKNIWEIKRRIPSTTEINHILKLIKNNEKVVFLCGGGVKYSLAGNELEQLATKLNIPIVETQAGKSAIINNELVLGGVGVTGSGAANKAVEQATLVIAFGSRLNDFTSQSASFTVNKKLINVNIGRFDKFKQGAYPVNADIKLVLEELLKAASKQHVKKSMFYKKLKEEWNAELKFLAENGTLIKPFGEEHIEKYKKDVKNGLNQTQVILKLNDVIEENAIVVTASGSLPGDLERLWNTKMTNGYHVEYGYSCMGYEINAALGVKLASPERPVYSFVGDGSFNMLHSEILTSHQYDIPINILLFDNSGFGCINNLQREYGSLGYRTEFKKLNGNNEDEYILTNYSKIADGYGIGSSTIYKYEELNEIKDAKSTTLFEIKVLPKTMTKGYESWWDVGFNRSNKTEYQTEQYLKLKRERRKRNGTINGNIMQD